MKKRIARKKTTRNPLAHTYCLYQCLFTGETLCHYLTGFVPIAVYFPHIPDVKHTKKRPSFLKLNQLLDFMYSLIL